MLKWVGYVAGFVLTLFGAFVLWAQLPWPSDPGMSQAEAEAAAAPYAAAQIHRDEFGVPHIYGPTDADVAFGLGYAQAEDDWATVQTTLVAARGELARFEGAAAAPTDYVVQLLGIQDLVAEKYETELAADTRALVEAYAAGVTLYAARNPDTVWAGVLPVTGQDIVAGFVLRTPFMYGLDAQLTELFAEERQRSISMRDSETAFHWLETPRLPFGSNAYAIAPRASEDGATRLVINSHQPYEGPVAWYEARLLSDEGWDMVGGTFPGAPLILHGHNPDLGWAHTVNLPDLADIYVLDTEGDRYRLDGEWRDLERGNAALNVRLFGRFRWTINRETWASAHGPVVRTDHGDYAIRYSGMSEIGQVEQWYRMNQARDFETWMEAMAINQISSLNTVYADRDGHIAYLFNARMPRRASGYDWRQYLPGDRSDLIWQDFHPLSDLPAYIDPEAGWLVSANQTPFDAADLNDNLDPEDFPASFGIEPRMTNRGHRSLELMRADPVFSEAELLAIKFDKAYSPASAVGRLMAEILALDVSDDALLLEAQSLIRDWDMNTDVDNRHAAIGVLTAVRCIGNRHTNDPWLMEPRAALGEAAAELMRHHGRLDVRWGDINRIVRGDVDHEIGGGPDALRAVYGPQNGLGEDGRIHGVAGDTYIMIVEWSAEGEMRSRSIHQYGSATLDESSPHYDDQVAMFAREEWREMDLSRHTDTWNPARPQ